MISVCRIGEIPLCVHGVARGKGSVKAVTPLEHAMFRKWAQIPGLGTPECVFRTFSTHHHVSPTATTQPQYSVKDSNNPVTVEMRPRPRLGEDCRPIPRGQRAAESARLLKDDQNDINVR